MKRFQECNWFIRMWRRRHYWNVPFIAIHMTIDEYFHPDPDFYMGFKNHWGLAIGLAQCKMEWYYTLDEVKQHLKDKCGYDWKTKS